MRTNIEITEARPLLDRKGQLTQVGYAKKLLPIYDRDKVKGGLMRLKEWDYYYIGNEEFGLALTIADNSYMGLDSISFINFGDDPWEVTKSPMRALTRGKTNLPETSERGVSAVYGKGYFLKFVVKDGVRHLTGHMDKFCKKTDIDFDITLLSEPEDSMVIVTPFEKKQHFYYNQKINCMPAEGTVTLGGKVYEFKPENSFGVLDWGRGVWTYENTWYWGSASGLLDGESFGFNIGYGFGDTTAASENMIFYKGKAHKLGDITFNIPETIEPHKVRHYNYKASVRPGVVVKDLRKMDDFMAEWTITSDDGRFEMTFEPIIDRASCTDIKVIKSDQHQVFGKFTGTVILDDGTELQVKDFMGFAEKVVNKW